MTLLNRQLGHVSGFDPRSLGSLEAWYDALQPNGFNQSTPADGSNLAQWNDLSGKNRHATQLTAANQPQWRKAGVNILNNAQALSAWSAPTSGGTVSTGVTDPNGGTTAWAITFPTSTSVNSYSSFVPNISVPVTSVRKWYRLSIWLKTADASTTTVRVGLENFGNAPDGSGARFVNTYAPTTVTGTWTRFAGTIASVPANAPAGGANGLKPILYAFTTDGTNAPYSKTIQAWHPQLELVATGETAPLVTVPITAWSPPSNSVGLQFDGVGTSLNATLTPWLAHQTIYSVFQPIVDSGTAYGAIYHQGTAGAFSGAPVFSVELQRANGTVNGLTRTDLTALNNQTLNVTNVWADISTKILSDTLDATTTGLRKVYSAGTLASTRNLSGVDATTVTSSNNLWIGCQSGNRWYVAGILSTILVYSSLHDTATRHRMEQWLSARFNVPLNRP